MSGSVYIYIYIYIFFRGFQNLGYPNFSKLHEFVYIIEPHHQKKVKCDKKKLYIKGFLYRSGHGSLHEYINAYD